RQRRQRLLHHADALLHRQELFDLALVEDQNFHSVTGTGSSDAGLRLRCGAIHFPNRSTSARFFSRHSFIPSSFSVVSAMPAKALVSFSFSIAWKNGTCARAV